MGVVHWPRVTRIVQRGFQTLRRGAFDGMLNFGVKGWEDARDPSCEHDPPAVD
jgi:hypothetical protein